eukprot:scaffold2393_cov267-Pinguiococcus_pyrenoidosus.AAC.27
MEEVKTDLPEGVDSPDIVIQAMGLAVDSEVYVLCRALPRPTATSCQCHPMTFGISLRSPWATVKLAKARSIEPRRQLVRLRLRTFFGLLLFMLAPEPVLIRWRAVEAFAAEQGKAPDYAVGVEGGLCEDACFDEHGVGTNTLQCMAWISIYRPAEGRWGFGRSGAFPLPPALTQLVRQGMELGEAHDLYFSTVNSKQAGGTIGMLSKGRMSRAQYMQHTMMMALVPFVSSEHFTDEAATGSGSR